MYPHRRSIVAGGIQTGYLEAGSTDAEPLVLLHDGAFGSDASSCWSALLPELAPRHRVLAPDLIGHGGTRKLVAFDRDPMTQRIDHVREFCTALRLDRPRLVGSSFGGGMVLRGAAAGSLPMRAGVTIGGTGGLFMRDDKFADLQAYEPTEEWSRKVCGYLVDQPSPQLVRERLDRSMAPGHFECLAAPRIVKSARQTRTPDWQPGYRDSLTRVALPILIVAGADDELLEPGWAGELASLLPNARTATIAGTRHQPHLDRPDEVAKLVLDFFDGVT